MKWILVKFNNANVQIRHFRIVQYYWNILLFDTIFLLQHLFENVYVIIKLIYLRKNRYLLKKFIIMSIIIIHANSQNPACKSSYISHLVKHAISKYRPKQKYAFISVEVKSIFSFRMKCSYTPVKIIIIIDWLFV